MFLLILVIFYFDLTKYMLLKKIVGKVKINIQL